MTIDEIKYNFLFINKLKANAVQLNSEFKRVVAEHGYSEEIKLVFYFYVTCQMIYAYVRISTDKQTTENQKFEIQKFAKHCNLEIGKWVEETLSSRKDLSERVFGNLLNQLSPEDILIVSEISRMGRNPLQIMSILNQCIEKQVRVFAIKEGYELGDDINSKVFAFAFGLSAEIERSSFQKE